MSSITPTPTTDPSSTLASSSPTASASRPPLMIGNLSYVTVSGIGQTAISALTILGSMYLLISLLRQGSGKLRVRLLLGMIACDLGLGIIAFVPNVYVLSGGTLITGTSRCDWLGFLLTAIVFCQHLYTLMTAIATYLLLKHPLSKVTSALERYSWAVAPSIFVIAFAHSGGWWEAYGWSTTGTLCYYKTYYYDNGVDARDLVQFIPRAFVFVTILVLYSMLFKFLRRPDSIQLSSQFVSGEPESAPEAGKTGVPAVDWLKKKCGIGQKITEGESDPNAPWEQLQFVQVGPNQRMIRTDSGFDPMMSTPTQSILQGGRSNTHSPSHSRRPSQLALGPSIFSQMQMETPTANHSASVTNSPSRPSVSSLKTDTTDHLVTPLYETSSHRPSETATLVTTPEFRFSYSPQPIPALNLNQVQLRSLSPVLSQAEGKIGEDDRTSFDLQLDSDTSGIVDMNVVERLRWEDGLKQENIEAARGQTLTEYLKETAFDGGVGTRQEGGDSAGRAERGLGSNGGQQMSATAYFNRQASLLMLYFPLAYMAVFSLSLVRLLYDMVHNEVDPVLSMISTWFVLSVGLIDAIVYGIAEVVVKRRVRKKMGDRL